MSIIDSFVGIRSLRRGTRVLNFKKLFYKISSKNNLLSILIIIFIVSFISVQIYSHKKNLTINIDGKKVTVTTFKSVTSDILKEINIQIGNKDKITPALTSKVSKNDNITIKKAVNVTVRMDGKDFELQSAEPNIYTMLKAEGIFVKPEDKIIPDGKTTLSNGLNVEVVRVETKNILKNVPIGFKTIVKNDMNKDVNFTKTLQEGKKGEKQIITSVTYENGKETSSKIISEKIIKTPVDKILLKGTMQKIVVSRGASNLAYSRIISAKATAYYAFKGVGNTYTATGRKAVRDPSGYSTIAVDPRVIPYGTKMYIENYGYAIAADTGGAIKGNKIDVYFNTKGEALSWGVKHVNVFILK
jgi:uncharacterized protein YabE (DUF348 family)